MKICIVSPHIDDAILSCGVLIQRRLAAGDAVLILDIFSDGTNGENRQIEEAEAAQRIGARHFFLHELDAPDRDPRYIPQQELFLGSLEHVPGAYIEKIRARLADFFAAHAVDLAYFPLGAGTHIDHRIAFEAGRRIKGLPVRFYEDRPYIIWTGILQSRMNDLGSDAELPRVTKEQMRAAADARYYLTHFMPAGRHRDESLPLYLAGLDKPSARTLKSASETLVATEDELKKLYHALAAYTSQMKLIYPDYATFIKDSLAYERAASGRDVYAERSWAFGDGLSETGALGGLNVG